MEKTAIQFQTMDFNEQAKIINATLTNCAKLINDKQLFTITDKGENNGIVYRDSKSNFTDALKFRFENSDELFNMAWLNCMETYALNPLMPLALFVSKASGKALNSLFYQNSKSASLIDYETQVNCADCFDDYSVIFDIERIEDILSYVRNDIKANCATTIDMLILGYNYKEIAKYLKVNVIRIYKYVSAIVNACAIVNAMDKEWNALDKIIASDISYKDIISRKMIEKAIIAEYKKQYPKHENMVIDWQTALDRLKASAYYEYDKSALASAFYAK